MYTHKLGNYTCDVDKVFVLLPFSMLLFSFFLEIQIQVVFPLLHSRQCLFQLYIIIFSHVTYKFLKHLCDEVMGHIFLYIQSYLQIAIFLFV